MEVGACVFIETWRASSVDVDEKCAVRNGWCHASHIIRSDSSRLFLAASRPTGIYLYLVPSFLLLVLPASAFFFVFFLFFFRWFSSTITTLLTIPISGEIKNTHGDNGDDGNGERLIAVRITFQWFMACTHASDMLAQLDSLQRAACVYWVRGLSSLLVDWLEPV